MWQNHSDPVLATLCKSLLHRNLFKIDIRKAPFSESEIHKKRTQFAKDTGLSIKETEYFIFSNRIKNNAYNPKKDKINLLYKDGSIKDIAKAADQLNINALTEEVVKNFLCYPKQIIVDNLNNI
jgi:hypothetical protein